MKYVLIALKHGKYFSLTNPTSYQTCLDHLILQIGNNANETRKIEDHCWESYTIVSEDVYNKI